MFATVSLLLLLGCAFGREDPGWSYSGANGSSQWPSLFPENCASKRQSPINICPFNGSVHYDDNLCPIVFDGYEQTLSNSKIENTGRTVEITPSDEEFYTISGCGLPGTFQLHNVHFHWGRSLLWGSEHQFCGRRYPLEAHFVHRNVKYATIEDALKHPDGVAVLGVLYKLARIPNPALSSITGALQDIKYASSHKDFDLGYPLSSLLPPRELCTFFRYNGSLTTPNCTEGVTWTVFIYLQGVTPRQIGAFRKVYENREGEPNVPLVNNFRPVQAINGRRVLLSSFGC